MMRLFVFFASIAVCYALVGQFDNDLANIGQYIASDIERTYHPYAPSSPHPKSGWDYEVEGFFPTHGYVSNRFFSNSNTGTLRTCFRTFGGKACVPPVKLLDGIRFATRIIDTYFCFTGIRDGPDVAAENAGVGPLYKDLRFGAYVPRFTAGLGFDELGFTALGRNLSQYTTNLGEGPPHPFSRLMKVMQQNGGKTYMRNISFVEFTYWDLNRQKRTTPASCGDAYHTNYDIYGGEKTVPFPLSGELNGLILFDSSPECNDCVPRKDDADCPAGALDPFQCLYGQTEFPNFMSKCSLAEDFYSVRCMDPKFIENYAYIWRGDLKSGETKNVLSGATTFFVRKFNADSGGYMDAATYERISTNGYITFPSWNDNINGYFDPSFQQGYDAKVNNRHYATIRTIYPDHMYELYRKNLGLVPNAGSNAWGGSSTGQNGQFGYWNFLGRHSSDDAITLACPVAKNAVAGVYNGTQCNAGGDNLNICNSDIGRCFCSKMWFGIACDIPIPSDIKARTSDPLQWLLDVVDRSASQGDPFQICSTAGKFSSSYTVFYLPDSPTTSRGITLRLCECMNGFEGKPDDIKSFVPVYASLFHLVAAAAAHGRMPTGIPISYTNVQEWFTPYHSQAFKDRHGPIYDGSDVNVLKNMNQNSHSDTNQIKLFFDWPWHILKHQCLIWRQSATVPPLNLHWDYQSFPFVLSPNGPGGFVFKDKPSIYPWPAISTTTCDCVLAATYTGPICNHERPCPPGYVRGDKQGIRCIYYDETDCVTKWNPNTDPQAYVCDFLNFLYNGPFKAPVSDPWKSTGTPKARLYGGDDCSPCPSCNRDHSDCVTVTTSTPILKWTPDGCRTKVVRASQPVRSDADMAPILQLFTGDVPHRFVWRDIETSIMIGVYDCISPCVRNDERLSGIGSGAVLGNGGTPESFCHQQVASGATISKRTACNCDVNYCGPTCNTQVCPTINGKVCGNGTCTLKPGVACGYDGNTSPGVCVCDNGWEGVGCNTPICPFDSDGKMCGGKGTCDPVSRRCICTNPHVDGGPACTLKACPIAHGLECSGAVVLGSNPPASVCNRYTGKCECFRTMPFPAVRPIQSIPGWPDTDVTVHWQGKWGVACENDYGDVCRDAASGLWCGQKIDSSGNVVLPYSPSYAGCYNKTCQNKKLDAAGLECKPSCKCALEYATSPNCEVSICGHDRCGVGRCHLTCVDANSQSATPCTTTDAITKGLTDIKAECICGVSDGKFYASKVKGDPCDTEAPACYTGDNSSPCNQRGDCMWNSTHFVCHCDANHFGAKCEIAPTCLTPLGDPCNYCAHLHGGNNPVSCTCPFGYLRDANRVCNQERCVKSGGIMAAGNETCLCPRGLKFHAIPDISDIVSTQTKLGCRKGCPINPDVSSVECGANEQITVSGARVNRSRCADLMSGDPIYNDDPRPAPVCNCSFFARDVKGGINYFISDGNGGCKPKCNPEGLCKPGVCNGDRAVDPITFACECNRGWTGPNCDQMACSGRMHHTNIDATGPCVCNTWCRSGPNCDVDTCALSGGVCVGTAPNDCDCSANDLLKLNNSQSTRRQCISACQNGGTLDSGFTQCLCPQPYYGRWCEQRQQCNIQFNGSNCDINVCLNGGTPRPKDQVGCVCRDSYFQGTLCQIDVCTHSGRMHRSDAGSCVCNTGWSGASCMDSTCLPGGEPDPVTGFCNCRVGYNRTIDNIGCSVVTIEDCGHGDIAFRADGTQYCACQYNYTGTFCSELACAAPFIVLHKSPVDNRAVCGCPPTLYGDQCTQSYCSFGSWWNPDTKTTECKCPFDYRLAVNGDPLTGVRQCVPNPYVCDPIGTVNWNSVANHYPCTCKPGFSGNSCKVLVTPSSVPPSGGSGGAGLSTMEIAGLAAGLTLVALFGGGMYYFCKYKYNTRTKMRHRKKSYSRIE